MCVEACSEGGMSRCRKSRVDMKKVTQLYDLEESDGPGYEQSRTGIEKTIHAMPKSVNTELMHAKLRRSGDSSK